MAVTRKVHPRTLVYDLVQMMRDNQADEDADPGEFGMMMLSSAGGGGSADDAWGEATAGMRAAGGDLNDDTHADETDLDIFSAAYSVESARADMNGDRTVDSVDLALFWERWAADQE